MSIETNRNRIVNSAHPSVQTAEVILIPKQLRMEWTDVLALDPTLSHVAFRVACVIGHHFNRHRGSTYIGQDTIARLIDKSERTVWGAIMEIERKGYLIVGRREHNPRASDGRRVAGGRGYANTYAPALDRKQLSATNSGVKLAARCDLAVERSQIRSPKIATDCDPTLVSSPSEKKNPSALERECGLGEPGLLLRKTLGPKKFDQWFSDVEFLGVTSEGCLRLATSTKFRARWISDNFGHQLLDCWGKFEPRVEDLSIVSR